MVAKVILNPYAGRWKALQQREAAEAALHEAGVEYELAVTEAPGHGVQLAEEAARAGFSPVISAGGDGSISEVVNGLARAAGLGEDGICRPLTPLGIMPLGSANDLVDNLGLPGDLESAAQVIAAGAVRRYDLCLVRWQNGKGNGNVAPNVRFFDNNAAIGLEPYITLKQQRIQKLRGSLRYLLATLQGILDKPEWEMELTWEGGGYTGPVSLVTVGNSPRTGGLFYVTPHASPTDGQLTFVYGFLPTRRALARALPMLMKSGEGNYVEHPAVFEVHSPWLRVASHNPTPLHADGEIQSSQVHQLEFRVLPGCLPLLHP